MVTSLEQSLQPRLGVSACLMGHAVRFDGGHKKNAFIYDVLTPHFRITSVCPELEAGFTTPRKALQLRLVNGETRVVVNRNPDIDHTDLLREFSSRRVDSLDKLDGFIFKKGSPSCGAFQVPVVINKEGYRKKQGTGIFAAAFSARFPLIPVEEEGRLCDAELRANFFERVYAYRRWKAILEQDSNKQGFIEFHSHHKLQLMARGSHYYRELGRMVAGVTSTDLKQRREAYILRFMQVMGKPSNPGRQVNVLQHIMGYLKLAISSDDKQELLGVIEAYRIRQLPLITPIILLKHHLRKHPDTYLSKQHYLNPFPEQLALRSVL